MFKTFNVNHSVKVKLTDAGIAELKRQHDDLYENFPEEYKEKHPFTEPKKDDEGYTKFQMWSLISQLGHTMQMGFSNHGFETDILIDMEEDNV